jgi:hypothetical protein
MRLRTDAGTAEDLAHETLFHLWRRAALDAADKGGASTWVVAVARNLRSNGLRRGVPRQALPEELLGGAGPRVRAALSSLTADERDVVMLSHLEGLSVTGRYRIGDAADVQTIKQRPVADPGPHCICLVASQTPARFRGLIGVACGPCTADI